MISEIYVTFVYAHVNFPEYRSCRQLSMHVSLIPFLASSINHENEFSLTSFIVTKTNILLYMHYQKQVDSPSLKNMLFKNCNNLKCKMLLHMQPQAAYILLLFTYILSKCIPFAVLYMGAFCSQPVLCDLLI